MYFILICSPEKYVVHEIMWKNVVELRDLHAG